MPPSWLSHFLRAIFSMTALFSGGWSRFFMSHLSSVMACGISCLSVSVGTRMRVFLGGLSERVIQKLLFLSGEPCVW